MPLHYDYQTEQPAEDDASDTVTEYFTNLARWCLSRETAQRRSVHSNRRHRGGNTSQTINTLTGRTNPTETAFQRGLRANQNFVTNMLSEGNLSPVYEDGFTRLSAQMGFGPLSVGGRHSDTAPKDHTPKPSTLNASPSGDEAQTGPSGSSGFENETFTDADIKETAEVVAEVNRRLW
ncbi:hypothetical protein IAT40_006832 [Kwoniella sp. CBS 6097]